MNVTLPTATKLVAITNALAARRAVDWFIQEMAEMTCPIPGDEISEGSEVTYFELVPHGEGKKEEVA
jgi:hypothetical protein